MSTIEAPVETTTSTMLFLTMSTYTCMHPPALVLPASVSIDVHPLSPSIRLNISAAFAVSRDAKDILRIASIIGRASICLMSTCSIVSFSNSFLLIASPSIFTSSYLHRTNAYAKLRNISRNPAAPAPPIAKGGRAQQVRIPPTYMLSLRFSLRTLNPLLTPLPSQ